MFRPKICFSDTHQELICPKTLFLSTIGGDLITFLETVRGFRIKKNCINTLMGQAKNSFPAADVQRPFHSEAGARDRTLPARLAANPRKQRGVRLSLP